jgi:hypothetical protein
MHRLAVHGSAWEQLALEWGESSGQWANQGAEPKSTEAVWNPVRSRCGTCRRMWVGEQVEGEQALLTREKETIDEGTDVFLSLAGPRVPPDWPCGSLFEFVFYSFTFIAPRCPSTSIHRC